MGYGHIGKVHQQAISEVPVADLVAIIDPAIKQEYIDEIPVFKNLEQFVQSDLSADVVSIATPNGMHVAHAEEALHHNFHVVIEKPVTLSSVDLEQILYLAKIHNKRLFSVLQLRYSPVVQFVKELIDSKKLGDIYLVNVQCYWNRNKQYYQLRDWHGKQEMDGGVLFTQFSHFVDVLHYWFDELKPKDIRSFNFAHKDCTDFADSGVINFKLKDSGFGTMTYTTATYPHNFDSSITLLGEKGTLQIGGQYMNQFNYFNVAETENKFENTELEKKFHPVAFADICRAIKQEQASILDAKNARNVIRFLETVS